MKYNTCTEYWLNTDDMTLRGDFEGMYKEICDPWGCAAASDSLVNKLFLEMIFYQKTYRKILDVGCGLGAFANELSVRNGGGVVKGCDISKTAIEKAARGFPGIDFSVRNVMTDELQDEEGGYDLVVLSEVVWYILDGIEDVFNKIFRYVCPGGVIAIHQYFPDSQKFGKSVIDGIGGFEKFVQTKTRFVWRNKVVYYGGTEGTVLLALLERR